MASLNFANMNRHELSKLRRQAIKAGERASAKNNYFTATFSAGVSNKQPDDYVTTALFKDWCEHHGPSNHPTAECRNANGVKTKPSSQLRAEANRRAQILYERELEKTFIAMKIKERRQKQAAKRRQSATEGWG